ncbi:MAG: single-stranded DNA-binding protein [Brevinematia bacterium]
MARSFNKVVIVGNLVKDPETLITQQGKTVSRIRLAVDDSFKDKKRTYFFDIICWEGIGEIVGKYTKKGDKILIEGRLTQSTWKSRDQNGNEITKTNTEIVAENILLLSPKQREENNISAQNVQSYREQDNQTDIKIKQGNYSDFVSNQQYKDTTEGETFEEDFEEEFLSDDIKDDEYYFEDGEPDYSELDDEENIKNIDTKREFDI